MIEVIRITSNIYDQTGNKFLTYRVHTVTQGPHILKIYQPFCRSSIRHNLFLNSHCRFWNSVPQDMVEVSNLNIFENRLDRYWCKRAFSFQYDSNAFEEICSDIKGTGLSGKHYEFRPVFVIGILGKIREKNCMIMMETVTDYSDLGDRIISGGGYQVAAAFRTRLVWSKFR